jgi:hypothetical protein
MNAMAAVFHVKHPFEQAIDKTSNRIIPVVKVSREPSLQRHPQR